MHPATRRAIFRRLQAANPSPTTELLYTSPFELLVAVMLSAHTTDRSVNAATRNLFADANTPAAIVALGVEGVKPYIKPVGLYNTKAKNLVGLAQQLLERHDGQVPATRADLEALPGVGRKTASIILNMVFGEVEIAVDTHIFRVANRTGLAPGKNPRAVEDALIANTPDEFKKNAHHWLLLHGRYVCTARKPACPKCIVNDLCEYPEKTPASELAQSDAPVAHEGQTPPAIASRIEAALKAKAGGQLDGKRTRRGTRVGKAVRPGERPGRAVQKKAAGAGGKKPARAGGRKRR